MVPTTGRNPVACVRSGSIPSSPTHPPNETKRNETKRKQHETSQQRRTTGCVARTRVSRSCALTSAPAVHPRTELRSASLGFDSGRIHARALVKTASLRALNAAFQVRILAARPATSARAHRSLTIDLGKGGGPAIGPPRIPRAAREPATSVGSIPTLGAVPGRARGSSDSCSGESTGPKNRRGRFDSDSEDLRKHSRCSMLVVERRGRDPRRRVRFPRTPPRSRRRFERAQNLHRTVMATAESPKLGREGSIPSRCAHRSQGGVQKAAVLPCKQNYRERYPAPPPSLLVPTSADVGGPSFARPHGFGSVLERTTVLCPIPFDRSALGLQNRARGCNSRRDLPCRPLWPRRLPARTPVSQSGKASSTLAGVTSSSPRLRTGVRSTKPGRGGSNPPGGTTTRRLGRGPGLVSLRHRDRVPTSRRACHRSSIRVWVSGWPRASGARLRKFDSCHPDQASLAREPVWWRAPPHTRTTIGSIPVSRTERDDGESWRGR